MANQAQDESIKVHATNSEAPTLTFVVPKVAINPDNTYGFSIPLDEAEGLIDRIRLALDIHRMEAETFEAESPLKGQLVDIKVGDELRRGRYVGIRGGKYLVANMGKTKHDYFHLDLVSFTFPDATESEEEHILALTDGWVR